MTLVLQWTVSQQDRYVLLPLKMEQEFNSVRAAGSAPDGVLNLERQGRRHCSSEQLPILLYCFVKELAFGKEAGEDLWRAEPTFLKTERTEPCVHGYALASQGSLP